MVYEDNLLQLFQKCQTCYHTCTVDKFVNGTFVSITQLMINVALTNWYKQFFFFNFIIYLILSIQILLFKFCVGLFTLPPQNTVEQPAIHLKYTSWTSAFVGGISLQWSILHTDPQGLSFVKMIYKREFSRLFLLMLCDIFHLLSAVCLECICPGTFNHQKVFLQPTILWHWRSEQNTMLERAKAFWKCCCLGW